MFQNFLEIPCSPPSHSHDRGHAGVVQLGEDNQHHIKCPAYGRVIKAHNGFANAVRAEVRLSGPAKHCDFDVYFDRKTHKRIA